MTPARDPKQLFCLWGSFLGSGGTLEAKNGFGGKMCQNHLVFSSKVTRATIWRRRDERDPHQVPQIATKVGERPRRGSTREAHGYPFLAARTPTDKLFGEKQWFLGEPRFKILWFWTWSQTDHPDLAKTYFLYLTWGFHTFFELVSYFA